jgi:bacillithiol system protein YtxJ
MGFLNDIFGRKNSGGKEEKNEMRWIPLESMEQLDLLEERSDIRTQLVFKHSTTCGISRMVLNMFKEDHIFGEGQIDLYYLDLHRFREVSNGISGKFNVPHQSPQLLVVKNRTLVAHASHGAISDLSLEKYL